MPQPPVAVFVGFAHALRAAGLAVEASRTQTFLDACARLDAGSPTRVYWAGRATLCADPGDVPVYDRAFEHWFGDAAPVRRAAAASAGAMRPQDAQGDRRPDADGDLTLRVVASADELLRHRDIAELTQEERRRLARLFAGLAVRPPLRRRIRRAAASHGRIDAPATVREQLRHAGEPGPLHRRRARVRPRRIVLLVDVSGSMAPYADSLLRLAHRIMTVCPHTTEVYTLGTAVTCVSAPLRRHDVEQALREAGDSIPDWSGGTRLGAGLRVFLDRWGQRGTARGAVVVIASDGWEPGDAATLAVQMRRLRLLAHRVVWVNPHAGKPGYAPVQSGIVAALPYVDRLVAGHSLAAFAELLEVLADA